MNTDTIKRLFTFLSSASKIERGSLYQLVHSAEASSYLRDIQSQHETALLLQSFGYPFNQIGNYYESVYLHRIGQHQKARELLESVAESAPPRYRSKALLSLSAVEAHIGRFEESLRLRLQISSSGDVDPITLIEAQRGIALLRALEGDHRGALRDLEQLLPLAHVIGKRGHPAYFDFLNSFTVELAEGNRTEEAEQVASVVAASPFISRYPEWQETVLEIEARRKRPAMVTIPQEYSLKYREPRVQAAIDFIVKNLHRTITVDDISKAVGVSFTHFSRIFKAETGLTQIDFLIRLRLERARALLQTGDLSVKQVMAAVGYNNKTNFGRAFKKRFRITPSDYKKQEFRRQRMNR